MFASTLSRTLSRSLLALALSAAAGLASADTLHVELNTAGLGESGWIDLFFGAGNGSAALATADLSHFGGFNAGVAAQTGGGVSGSLASGYQLLNSDGGADLFHAVNFGGKVSFDISFSGAADPAASGVLSTFSVALYGADQSTPLGHYDGASSSLLQLVWTPSSVLGQPGAVSPMVFDNAVASVSAVPEPSAWLMLGAGLALVGALSRRRSRQPA